MDNRQGDGMGSTGNGNGQAAVPTPSFRCNVRRFPPTPSQYYQSDEPPARAFPGQTSRGDDRALSNTRKGDEGSRDTAVSPITPAVLRAMLTGGIYYDAELPGRVIHRGDWAC